MTQKSKTTSIRLVVYFMAILFIAMLFGCTPSTIGVESITLDKAEATIKVGETTIVVATVLPADATDKTVVWRSFDETIATVSNGVIEGVGVGQVGISATAGKKTASLIVTVLAGDHTITFNSNGGSAVSNQVVADAGQAVAPTPPTKEGFDFVGWFRDSGLTQEYTFGSIVSEDLTLFAKWVAIEYTVTFFIDDDTEIATKVVHGTVATVPVEATKAGYTLVGWFADIDLTDDYVFTTPITQDLIIYSKWEANDNIPYQVKHLVYNAVTGGFDLDAVEDFVGTAGTTVSPTIRTYDGLMSEYPTYEATVLGDGSLVIEIKYVELNFTFEYVLNGGNFTYESRAAMTADFVNDYNTVNGYSYTVETLPMGAWVNVNFHQFFLNPNYKDKWMWMPKYLAVVGSTTNKKACLDITTVSTVSAFTSISSNWIYALSYEVRGFVAGRKYIENANWMSSDYSDYELANGFWPTFVANNETIKYENQQEPFTLPTVVYREGFDFGGWYLTPDFSGNPITVMQQSGKIYAKWIDKNPVTSIEITNIVSTLEKLDTLQLTINVLPIDAFNKNVVYSTSDEKILGVSDTGLITAYNAGTATITVTSVVFDVSDTIEITVLPQDDVDVRFDEDYSGVLYTNDSTQLSITGIGKYATSEFEFESSNTAVLTVSTTGLIEAKGIGSATISIKDKATTTTILTFTIPVVVQPATTRLANLMQLLLDNHNPVVDTVNASLYYDDFSAYQQYYEAVYGSVNLFLFDNLNLNDKDYLINPATQTSKHSGLQTSTEFITVHDTANLSGGLLSHASYWLNPTVTTSIHFTVGDYGVVQSLDTAYVAHHAGDGTSTAFSWRNTGIAANNNYNPEFDLSTDGFFIINGVKSSIAAPTGTSGMILDSSYFGNLGPTWTIGTDGNYYIGTLWFSTSQVARGIISSRGGNRNSIGIEMCVNTSGDIYDTWQRTAKLVGKLMIDHQLDIHRVVQHNTFSGKNCPQSLIMSDYYWDTFIEMVKVEHEIQNNYADATISMISHNPSILDNTGRIISQPQTSTVVSYTITVQIGREQQSITLYSIIPGTASWMQLNGFYSTR